MSPWIFQISFTKSFKSHLKIRIIKIRAAFQVIYVLSLLKIISYAIAAQQIQRFN